MRFRDETGDTDWAEADVTELAPQPRFLMPERLLLGVGAQEVADLLAYLKSLAR